MRKIDLINSTMSNLICLLATLFNKRKLSTALFNHRSKSIGLKLSSCTQLRVASRRELHQRVLTLVYKSLCSS